MDSRRIYIVLVKVLRRWFRHKTIKLEINEKTEPSLQTWVAV